MYAVIKAGGKQQRVQAGDVIEVEFMKHDPGSTVEFQPLVVIDNDGKAHHGKGLSKAKVVARHMGDQKGEKIKVFKYRPKSGYQRTQGHRQLLTLLEIEMVMLSPDQVARKPEEPAAEGEPAAPARKKPAAKKAAAKKTPAKKPAAKAPARKKPATKKPTTGRKKT
ncbi:MAG TPA: 50S ribosomal protein L21 [Actinomycetota bacterium]|jgi:large subunit ribosomal protein L21|nr:50S ribosomal protein L21 [Actinomycetota bacterium]